MQYIADLHLHSKYSRAVSQQMTLPVMAEYARLKGLDILSASDFTHPVWFKEISNQLEEAGEGLYTLKSEYRNPKSEISKPHPDPLLKGEGSLGMRGEVNRRILFLLSTEIASIYKQGDKLRRIHNLIFAPSLQTAGKISAELVKRGCNLNADGRPIIGLSSKNLLELILSIDEKCFLIPCHVWTPHFGLYGSASGFNSIEEAFGNYAKYIYGVETGLSSDPDMNWSVKELINRSILSFSDAHSPAKMGREATVFELDYPAYANIKEAIRRLTLLAGPESPHPAGNKILYTIEFYPEEGKYHFSGHRNCKISYNPAEIKEKGTICPVCHKRMTEGVLLRVNQLADSGLQNRVQLKQNSQGLVWHTDNLKLQPPYVKLVPLLEIIAESMHSTVNSQKVKEVFNNICLQFGSEIDVLVKSDLEEAGKVGGLRLSEGIKKIREGNLVIEPGFDGEYGKVQIWSKNEDVSINRDNKSQLILEF